MSAAQNRYSIQANKNRIKGPDIKVGDKVYLNRKNIRTQRAKNKFDAKFVGPFTVIKKVNDVAYKLELPLHWKIHPVFHVSLLEPAGTDPFPNQIKIPPPPDIIEDEFEFEVEKILGYRLFGIRKKPQYLVKWKGYSNDRNTWEPEEHLENAKELLEEFKDRRDARGATMTSSNRPRRGGNVTNRRIVTMNPKSPKDLI